MIELLRGAIINKTIHTKIMMAGLFTSMILLAIRSITLPGASAGLEFYLKPDFGKLMEHGLWTSTYAALGQAFFTLSLGIGSMSIFGSYIGKERSIHFYRRIYRAQFWFSSSLVHLRTCALE